MMMMINCFCALSEKCPSMEFFLFRIFPHSDWIRRYTEYLSAFSPNAVKCGPETTPYIDTFHAVAEKLTDERQLRLIFSRDHCQKFSPLQVSNTLQAGFQPIQNLTSDFVKWICAVVITTVPPCHKYEGA